MFKQHNAAFILLKETMSSISLPDPCLTAILLVCQTRSGSGPQLVFHWPPDPLAQPLTDQKSQSESGNLLDEDDTDDESGWSSSDESNIDDFGNLRDRFGAATANSKQTDWTNPDDHHDTTQSRATTILGLDEDGLVSLLAPDRTWNKRKFELSINDLTFIGRPIFAKQSGSWRRTPCSRQAKQQSTSSEAEAEVGSERDPEASTEDDTAKSASDEDAPPATKKTEQNTKSELVMFHIVFVMNPPPLDHTHRVKEMYDNVVKKFSRALKWVQARHDYVRLEAKNISTKRQQLLTKSESMLDTIMTELVESSPLAKAIMTVFKAISASKIASVTLLPGVSISMQIPPVTSTSYLPSLTEQPLPPGMWLTTATEAVPSEEATNKHAISSTTLQLAKSYTLLLKSPPQRITKDAQLAGGPIAAHLPKFVAALRPTKSFHKLSNSAQLSLADIQLFARHLIYWRRAIAIPPLHQRDTYIVSPNADFRRFNDSCKSYAAQFPAPLPSLPKLLADLSDLPRPFGSLIPSPDHKDDYMLALAWLLRNGWVTQLRTFAYVRVTSDIKQQARDRERESRTSVSQSFNSASESSGPKGNARPSFVSRRSSEGRNSVRDSRISDKVTSLIKSPPRASQEEFRWLNYIYDSMLEDTDLFPDLSEDERHELRYYWPMLNKYFDGSTALESIPVREGLKRKLVWNLYAKLGLRFDGKVEDSEGRDQRLLLTVRHW